MTMLELLDRRVASLRETRPGLEEALSVQAAMLRAALTSPRLPQTRPFPLPRDQALARFQNGVPLLHDQPVWLDIHFAADLFSRLANTLEDRGDGRLELLVHAATSGLLDPEQLFAEAFVNHPDHLMELASACGVDGDLLTTLATRAVGPVLQAYAQRLMPLVEHSDKGTVDGGAWTRGYCPICGSWPLLGELRDVAMSQAQRLRCSTCGSGWRFERSRCPYCANNVVGSLGVEGEHRFRLCACDRCKGYLKLANAFDPLPSDLLPLDDLASVRLDRAAIEHGYQRPSGSGYRIELAMPEVEWLEELA